MLDKNEYVLLRAIFNEGLHNAVLTGNRNYIAAFLMDNVGEYNNNSILNIEYIKEQHEKNLREDDFAWAL